METMFWLGFGGVAYAYFGYPLLLLAWSRIRSRPADPGGAGLPPVSVILPVHNEEGQLPGRLDNLLALEYPEDRVEILVVSDGSSDGTAAIAARYQEADPRVRLVELQERAGKGNALNEGVRAASHDVVVFTDAGILLEGGSLRALVAPLGDPTVGCVSGEDIIGGSGGEALYGRYELLLRRLEGRIRSIVGASGSIYAQRRELCPEFREGMAPDFLSVLHTVERGYRAVSAEDARGEMRAVSGHGREFSRKVRTLIRGMTALRAFSHLLNPFRYGSFSWILFSHKVMRWLVPFFLVMMLVGNAALLDRPFYRGLAIPHGLFYLLGAGALMGLPLLRGLLPARIAAYFVNVNASIAVAWWQFLRGERKEIWTPTRR
ncbi:MAG: glycosyltransferase family 2 protein [Gemmatimonadales bacterium]|nr:MAG: glycosyltransferase family 2 protein [Gemmatimonadales bacterium]